MRSIITQSISITLISACVITGWYVFVKPNTESLSPRCEVVAAAPLSTTKPAEQGLTPTVTTEQTLSTNEHEESVNIPGSYEYFDEEGISAKAAAEYREISVLPFNPKVVECKDAWSTEGSGSELLLRKVCTAQHKYPTHPYYDYETENLLQLANNHDPLAAAVLAERLTLSHPFEAIMLRLYSAISTNKPAPLLQIAQQHYPIEGVLPHVRERNLMSHYAHVSVAQRMGHPAADLSFAENAGSERLVAYQQFADDLYNNLQSVEPHTEGILTPELEAALLGKSVQQDESG